MLATAAGITLPADTEPIRAAMELLIQDALYSGALPDNQQIIRAFTRIALLCQKLEDEFRFRKFRGTINRTGLIVSAALMHRHEQPITIAMLRNLWAGAVEFASLWKSQKLSSGHPPDVAFDYFVDTLRSHAIQLGVRDSIPSHQNRWHETTLIQFILAVIRIAVRHGERALPAMALTRMQREAAKKALASYRRKSPGAIADVVERHRKSDRTRGTAT